MKQIIQLLATFFAVVILGMAVLAVMGAGIGTGHTLIDLAHLTTAQAEDSITPDDLAHGSLRFRDTSTVEVDIVEMADGTGAVVAWEGTVKPADILWAREIVGRPSVYPINAGDDVSLPTGNIEALTGLLISGTSISIDGTANPGTITESHGMLSLGDDGLITDGTFGAGAAWPWAGAGSGMVFCPLNGAFRAGTVSGTQWDVGNVGDCSFGGGADNTFSGLYAGGWGYGNIVSGLYAGGWGLNNIISGEKAGGWGSGNKITGVASGGWGEGNIIDGNDSCVIGQNIHLTIEGENSYAFGHHGDLLQLPEPDTFYAIVDEFIKADPDTFGAEKLRNGTFTGNANFWNLVAGWTYNANAVDKDGDGMGTLSQPAINMVTPPVADEIYLLQFTISNWTVGSVTPNIGGTSGATVSANGNYRQLILANNAGAMIFTPTNTARFTIDNVSLKEVTGGDMHVAGKVYSEGVQLTPDTTIPDTTDVKLNLFFSHPDMLSDDTWSKYDGVTDCSATYGWVAIRDCSITGMSCQQAVPMGNSGSWDIEVYANGAEVWSDTWSDGGDELICFQTQNAGVDNVSAGEVISVHFNETAGTDFIRYPHVIVEITYD